MPVWEGGGGGVGLSSKRALARFVCGVEAKRTKSTKAGWEEGRGGPGTEPFRECGTGEKHLFSPVKFGMHVGFEAANEHSCTVRKTGVNDLITNMEVWGVSVAGTGFAASRWFSPPSVSPQNAAYLSSVGPVCYSDGPQGCREW